MPEQLNPNVQFRSLVNDIGEVVDETILRCMEIDTSDQVLALLAEARGNVVRMNHALKIVNISISDVSPHGLEKYIDKLPQGAVPKPLDMPKLQKQPKPTKHTGNDVKRPGITKHLKGAKDFDCPTCGALKGTNCFKFTSPGGTPTDERRADGTWMHNKRQTMARDYNNRVRAKYDRDHFEADPS
jgi:hypothetical protein